MRELTTPANATDEAIASTNRETSQDPAQKEARRASPTPGPWTLSTVKTSVGVCHKIGPFPSKGVRSETYACVYEDGMHLWRGMDSMDSELLANARLIASAPDLLESCKELNVALAAAMRVVADLDTAKLIGLEDSKREQRFVDELHASGVKNGVGVRAKAAIAKAEGGVS